MNNYNYLFFIILVIILFIIFYSLNKLLLIEKFYITTWTPYIVDKAYQPGYSNYFYNNGYMYPIF
jgi:hypothetical protein